MYGLKKLSLWILSIWFCMGLSYAAQQPVPLLEAKANQLISKLKANQKDLKKRPQLIFSLVEQVILPVIDQPRMARSVVPRNQWNQATASERKAFSQAFKQLVIRTYASAFSEYRNESVRFQPLRGNVNNKSNVQVKSMIVRPGHPSIPVSYSLAKTNGQWKVYDFSVSGVSMVKSFRAQLAGLGQRNLAGVTQFLQKHNRKS